MKKHFTLIFLLSFPWAADASQEASETPQTPAHKLKKIRTAALDEQVQYNVERTWGPKKERPSLTEIIAEQGSDVLKAAYAASGHAYAPFYLSNSIPPSLSTHDEQDRKKQAQSLFKTGLILTALTASVAGASALGVTITALKIKNLRKELRTSVLIALGAEKGPQFIKALSSQYRTLTRMSKQQFDKEKPSVLKKLAARYNLSMPQVEGYFNQFHTIQGHEGLRTLALIGLIAGSASTIPTGRHLYYGSLQKKLVNP